jgi:hypothetical protein
MQVPMYLRARTQKLVLSSQVSCRSHVVSLLVVMIYAANPAVQCRLLSRGRQARSRLPRRDSRSASNASGCWKPRRALKASIPPEGVSDTMVCLVILACYAVVLIDKPPCRRVASFFCQGAVPWCSIEFSAKMPQCFFGGTNECGANNRAGQELRFEMEDGLYSAELKGFDGVEVPPGGVLILRNGTMYGGGPYSYFTGSYSAQNGFLRGELVVNQHTAPPSDHLLFSAGEVGMGISGSYEGDQAKLTGTVVIGKRCVTLQIALRKLADI